MPVVQVRDTPPTPARQPANACPYDVHGTASYHHPRSDHPINMPTNLPNAPQNTLDTLPRPVIPLPTPDHSWTILVHPEGFEPPRLSAPAPQAGVSAVPPRVRTTARLPNPSTPHVPASMPTSPSSWPQPRPDSPSTPMRKPRRTTVRHRVP